MSDADKRNEWLWQVAANTKKDPEKWVDLFRVNPKLSQEDAKAFANYLKGKKLLKIKKTGSKISVSITTVGIDHIERIFDGASIA